jgi:hydroxyacylglutathione hydrolase
MSNQIAFPDGAVTLDLDVAWIHGSEAAKYNTDPDIQVHACDEHTFILRQNMAVHFEAPFMFLLFGRSRAVLLDTGATASPEFFPLRRTVDSIIDGWLASHPHPDGYELLVLHTHSHTDHAAADHQFTDRPNTVVIGAKRDPAWRYFGFAGRPEGVAEVDLGGRSPGTPSTQAACTSSTGRTSPVPSTRWPAGAPSGRLATCSAATSR